MSNKFKIYVRLEGGYGSDEIRSYMSYGDMSETLGECYSIGCETERAFVALGVPRVLAILSHAIDSHAESEGYIDEEKEVVDAARRLIKYWREHDKAAK